MSVMCQEAVIMEECDDPEAPSDEEDFHNDIQVEHQNQQLVGHHWRLQTKRGPSPQSIHHVQAPPDPPGKHSRFLSTTTNVDGSS